MEQAMRDEFEAVYPLPEGMERNGESYTGGEMWWLWEERWQVWQRSRAALRVELPYPVIVDEGAEFAFHAYDKDETDKALQQAGIEVK
ncbi:TPA: hypothetical protein ACKP9G_003688 [Pseudomonas aeruginosa]